MNSAELWDRFVRHYSMYPQVGFALDISRIRFADDFLPSMEPRIARAYDEMEALEKGEIANADEQRMVGHYWLRTPDLAPTGELQFDIKFTLDRVKAFAKDIHSGSIPPEKRPRFDNVLLIGIGGSALGPQLLADALGSSHDKMELHFCDNTDPDGLARLFERLNTELDRTLTIVISKSGSTPETRNGAVEAAAAYKKRGLSFARHAVAVTCEGSKLDKQAKEEEWLARFPMWDWVGGRTSLFSAVGLLPAALQGIDVDQFIAGAREMDALTRSRNTRQNPAALLALMWYAAGSGKGLKDMVVLPYRDRLVLFSKYLQQLVMESLGKEKDRQGNTVNQGIAVYGNKGSTDQHAYVQQLREGINNFFVTFIRVTNDLSQFAERYERIEVEPGVTSGDYLLGFQLGTRRALYENGRDSITIDIERLDTRSLGALIALFDRAVGYYASLVDVNAYHQPGVEAGKKAAANVLEVQKAVVNALASVPAGDGETVEAIAKRAGVQDEVETVFCILRHLAANESSDVVCTTPQGSPREWRFAPRK